MSHIPRASNEVANDLAQHAFGYKLMVPDINSIKNNVVATINHQPSALADQRHELIQYLTDPLVQVDFKLRQKGLKYVLIDSELFRRRQGVLLKCLTKEDAIKVMREVH